MKLEDIKTLITSGVIIIGVVLYLIFSGDPKDKTTDTSTDKAETTTAINAEQAIEQSEHAITIEDAEKATGNAAQEIEFISVNDGDTFAVKLDGQKQKVRLLMIDTPEMNYDKGDPMPYAEEAKAFTTDILKNAETIELLFDKGPETDNYDRLLAYIFVDGVSLQELLLQEGLAAVRYVNKPNNTLENDFRDIQADAEANGENIWSLDGYFENNNFDKNYSVN